MRQGGRKEKKANKGGGVFNIIISGVMVCVISVRPPDTLIFSPLLVADIFHRVNSVLTIYFLHNLVERYGRLYIHFSFVKKKNISRNIRKWRPTMFLFAKWKNGN